jgi:hypothetical protein
VREDRQRPELRSAQRRNGSGVGAPLICYTCSRLRRGTIPGSPTHEDGYSLRGTRSGVLRVDTLRDGADQLNGYKTTSPKVPYWITRRREAENAIRVGRHIEDRTFRLRTVRTRDGLLREGLSERRLGTRLRPLVP